MSKVKGGPFRPGPDPRRNMKGRPKLSPEQRDAIRRCKAREPEVIDQLLHRLLDVAPKSTAEWLSLYDRWRDLALGQPMSAETIAAGMAEDGHQLPADPAQRLRMLEEMQVRLGRELAATREALGEGFGAGGPGSASDSKDASGGGLVPAKAIGEKE